MELFCNLFECWPWLMKTVLELVKEASLQFCRWAYFLECLKYFFFFFPPSAFGNPYPCYLLSPTWEQAPTGRFTCKFFCLQENISPMTPEPRSCDPSQTVRSLFSHLTSCQTPEPLWDNNKREAVMQPSLVSHIYESMWQCRSVYSSRVIWWRISKLEDNHEKQTSQPH